MSEAAGGQVFHLRNVLLIAGVLVASAGTVYFATELHHRLSEAGRVLSLLLLSLVYGGLGHHFQDDDADGLVVEKRGWRWLRVSTILYGLGLLAAATGVIVFLSIDALDRLVKAGAVIALGLALILLAARRFGGPEPGEEA